jgi:hypothetical protein
MAQERLDVAQVGSALIEEEGGGRMPQGKSGNNGHPRALARELLRRALKAFANGRAVPARKDQRGARS